jgi:hypothetical protein
VVTEIGTNFPNFEKSLQAIHGTVSSEFSIITSEVVKRLSGKGEFQPRRGCSP